MKLHEILELHYELNGVSSNEEGKQPVEVFQGVLRKDIGFKSKYYLLRLNKWVTAEKDLYEEARKELFKKFGEEKEGGMIEIPKEKMDDFMSSHNDLLSAEKEVNLKDICGASLTIDTFEGVTGKEVYSQLSNLIEA